MKINQQKVTKAIEVLSKSQMPESGFPNALKGDISSFGASIIQAGLLPSVLFFSEGALPKPDEAIKWSETKDRRAQLMSIIAQVAFGGELDKKRPLFDKIKDNPSDPAALRDITEAALAVKVAMRAFKFDK